MSKGLESPYTKGKPDWDALYRARGDNVGNSRPFFTGDVFTDLQLPGSTGRTKARSVIILQHPCSMRTNGVDLAWQVLVAEVTNRKQIDEQGWVNGNYNLMPLPDIRPEVTSQSRNQAANFDNLYTIAPALLTSRIASLSPFGVNLLLQRWVHLSCPPTHSTSRPLPSMRRPTSSRSGVRSQTTRIYRQRRKRALTGCAPTEAARPIRKC